MFSVKVNVRLQDLKARTTMIQARGLGLSGQSCPAS